MVDAGQHHHPRPSAGSWCAEEKRGHKALGLGRSRGAFSTKLSAATDALGNPCRLLAGPGQENDMAKAFDLIEGLKTDAVLADRAYDADRLMDAILDAGTEPVIPPKRRRKHQHAYDKALYKERNLIERFFNKLKQFRRIATRYDKLLNNFMGFVKIAAIDIWLR
jgi:transposase